MPRPPGSKDCAESIDAVTDGTEKSLPLEGGAPRSESKIYMTAGGSHTSTYGGPAQAGPDEVEGNSVVPTYGDHWWLRPHPSALAGCQLLLQEKPSAPPPVSAYGT